MDVDVAVIRKMKRGGGFGRWPAYEIAHDDHGHWLFSPKGTIYWGHQAGREPVEWDVGRPSDAREGMPQLWLLAAERWWVAVWYVKRGVHRVSVDICTPPAIVNDEWVYEDLELDPYWGSDGALGIADEDEFLDACNAGQISTLEAERARATSTNVLNSLRVRAEPFGAIGWSRFGEGMELGLPPIRKLARASSA